MAGKISIAWLKQPEKKDYPAAASVLTLLFDEKAANRYVRRLSKAPISQFKARDILRMCDVSALGIAASDDDRKRILAGKPLSPLLLVRDSRRVIVADGYHRLCTVYTMDENAMIPCKIV